MAYPYDAADLAALSRLQITYNGGDYDAGSNPGGFGQGGHVVNFVPALADVAIAGGAVADAADSAEAGASAAAASATAAAASAANLQGTSTTSNTVSVGSKSLTTQSGKSFAAGLPVAIRSAANPTVNRMGGIVSSYSGTALVVDVTEIGSGSGNSAADWTIQVSGAPGVPGSVGSTGSQGATPAVQMTFSTATGASDPGNGFIKFNNVTIASVTEIYFDNVDNIPNLISPWVDTFDDSTNTALRGEIHIRQLNDPTKWALFYVTGTVTDSIGYRTVSVTYVAGVLPDNNAVIGIVFARTGNQGADGAGAGDVVSIETAVTDAHLVVWNSTTGKSVKTAGFGVGTSGEVLAKLSTANTWSGVQTYQALVDINQDMRLSGDISPTQIAANTDDYAPTNLATSSVLRLTTDASRNLTGITGGSDGRILLLMNVGSNNLVLKDETTSTAANRFSFGGDVTLGAKQVLLIWYDSTSSRWRMCYPFIAGASGHTVVYADGANILSGIQTFAAKVDFQQDIYESGDISPTQITANTDDYNPTNLATSSILRLTSDAFRNITGLQGGADGRKITIINVGSNPIVLKNADTASSAANRFLFGADVILTAEQSISLWYDSTSSRWRLANASTTGYTVPLPRSYLAGLGISNNGSDANNDIDIAVGDARDSTNAGNILLAAALTKRLDATWAVGTNQGGIDTGAKANSTWYHLWVIKRVDTGVVDVLFSVSATAPTMPTNYTLKRRIGPVKTDGSGNILAFVQSGDTFTWAVPVTDHNANNPGTSAILRALSTPLGVQCEAIFHSRAALSAGSSATATIYTDPAITDTVPDFVNSQQIGNETLSPFSNLRIRTNTSSQIRVRLSFSSALVTSVIVTDGWVDTRDKLA